MGTLMVKVMFSVSIGTIYYAKGGSLKSKWEDGKPIKVFVSYIFSLK